MIARTGIGHLPAYSDLIPIEDAPGFAVRRRYPPDAELDHIVNNAGEGLVRSIIQLVVEPPTAPAGVSAVILRAWVFPRWKETHLFHGPTELPPGHPATPTQDSLQRWRRARKPIQVDLADIFLYDAGEDRFTDVNGTTVSTQQMLDYVYDAHCRTLRTGFVWRWNAESFSRWVAQRLVWESQDGLLLMLLRFYDIELTTGKQRLSPFHRFRRSDFARATEPAGHQSFFGFQSSRKSFFSNLLAVTAACVVVYRYGPRGGLLSSIYRNDALTTAALLLGFLVADVLGPAILITVICGLSRLRPLVMFLPRRVRA